MPESPGSSAWSPPRAGTTRRFCSWPASYGASSRRPAGGTGAGPLCDALGTHLAVLPQVLTWFPVADRELLTRQPEQVFIRSSRAARFYGFPSADGWTVKVAASVYLDEVASMARPPSFDPRHLDTIQSWVAEFLPALVPRPVRAVVCADGYTADETGLLGAVPGLDGVVVAVGFSGHGFKMATSLGAVAADLIETGQTATPCDFLNPARFLAGSAALTPDTLARAVAPAAR